MGIQVIRHCSYGDLALRALQQTARTAVTQRPFFIFILILRGFLKGARVTAEEQETSGNVRRHSMQNTKPRSRISTLEVAIISLSGLLTYVYFFPEAPVHAARFVARFF